MSDFVEKTICRDSTLRELAAESPLHLRIQGDCMSPLLKDGAVVQISSRRFYWPGDVLIFRGRDGQVLIHRLLGCYLWSNGLRFLTKADNGSRPDGSVTRQQVIGKVCGGEVSPQLSSVPLRQRFHAFFCFVRLAVRRIIPGS
jgi:phage repressor protein C with HTH and peptisase S24 domain